MTATGPDDLFAAIRRANAAMARFHVRIGQVGRATHRDEYTLPLFPLVLILDADGTLAADARQQLLDHGGVSA